MFPRDPEFQRLMGLRSWLARCGTMTPESLRAGCPDEMLSDEPDETIIAKAPRGFYAGDLP